MIAGAFLMQNDGEPVQMQEQPYDTEKMLQELLAKNPDVLAGGQAAGRRWLLIAREMFVPEQDQGGDRWFMDHLFLDQDAIPTLVEVKRSENPQIRREIVGQMLDYAARVLDWPLDAIRSRFEQVCQQRNTDPAAEIAAFGVVPEQFWQKVERNLQTGHIRMVFVADKIPRQLQRIVEFMSSQMRSAKVHAVEIKRFVNNQGLAILVPRVIGYTEEPRRKLRKLKKVHDAKPPAQCGWQSVAAALQCDWRRVATRFSAGEDADALAREIGMAKGEYLYQALRERRLINIRR